MTHRKQAALSWVFSLYFLFFNLILFNFLKFVFPCSVFYFLFLILFFLVLFSFSTPFFLFLFFFLDPEDIMLSEIKQIGKDKCHMIPPIN